MIRNRMFLKVGAGSGSCQKSSGSATLTKRESKNRDSLLRHKNIENHASLGSQSKFWKKILKSGIPNPRT
jgi:hypothetical protein